MEQSNTLNRPLPPDVVFLNHGWFTRYRMYPTFSGRWLRGRFLLFSTVLVVPALLVLVSVALTGEDNTAVVSNTTASLLFTVLISFFAGPALAALVRHAKWPARREAIGVVCAIVLGWGIAAALNVASQAYMESQWANDPSRLAVKEKQTRQQKLSRGKQIAMQGINYGSGTVLYLLFGGGFALMAYFRERVRLAASLRRRELAAANAARREAELRLSVLQAQVEPHFLFNTFAGLRGLIREEPDRAVMLLDRLTDYLRASIPKMRDDGVNDSSTIGAQIDSARAYLELMKVRMGERLSFELDVDDTLRKADFPPLMVISLVENAIKHGIEPQPQGGHVALFVHAYGDRLRLTVADNGIGFAASQAARTSSYQAAGRTKSGGLGLTNIRAQLKTIYGDTASLTMKNPTTGGFAATIELPFVLEDANV